MNGSDCSSSDVSSVVSVGASGVVPDGASGAASSAVSGVLNGRPGIGQSSILEGGSGVVAIRNLKTDRVFLFYSSDIKGDCVKSRFKLDLGMHECRSLQEDYSNTGLEVFRFDVIELTGDPARLDALRKEASSLYE